MAACGKSLAIFSNTCTLDPYLSNRATGLSLDCVLGVGLAIQF